MMVAEIGNAHTPFVQRLVPLYRRTDAAMGGEVLLILWQPVQLLRTLSACRGRCHGFQPGKVHAGSRIRYGRGQQIVEVWQHEHVQVEGSECMAPSRCANRK
jgi:hypothetical protein